MTPYGCHPEATSPYANVESPNGLSPSLLALKWRLSFMGLQVNEWLCVWVCVRVCLWEGRECLSLYMCLWKCVYECLRGYCTFSLTERSRGKKKKKTELLWDQSERCFLSLLLHTHTYSIYVYIYIDHSGSVLRRGSRNYRCTAWPQVVGSGVIATAVGDFTWSNDRKRV